MIEYLGFVLFITTLIVLITIAVKTINKNNRLK